MLSPMKQNLYENSHNKQALLFFCNTYNLGELGTDLFLSYVFVCPGGTSKGHFFDPLKK